MPCTNPGRARLHAQQRGGVAGGRGQQVGAVARRAQRAAQPPELLRRPPEPSLQHAPQHRVRPNHTYVIAMAPRAPQLRMRHVRRGTCTLQHHRFCRARRRACISQAPDKAFAAPGPLGRLAPCTPTPGCAGGGGGGGGARLRQLDHDLAVARERVRPRVARAAQRAAHLVVHVRQPPQQLLYLAALGRRQLQPNTGFCLGFTCSPALALHLGRMATVSL